MAFQTILTAILALVLSSDARTPIRCADCEEWNKPQRAFQIYGHTYYVGTRGLSAVLITGSTGHILIDGAMPQSVPHIEDSIRQLGFRVEDIKLIVNSHTHFDHAGGIAALQIDSGATVAASTRSAEALRDGHPVRDDPQFGPGPESLQRFPAVAKVQVIKDGETLRVGDLAITAIATPGHTPGSTSWTWKSCEGARCLDVVYADSVSAIVEGDFRFSGDSTHPDIGVSFAQSIARVGALPCDVLLTPHPDASNTFEKLGARTAKSNPFINKNGCRAYADGAAERLKARLDKERNTR